MDHTHNFRDILDSVAARMLADFRGSRTIKHAGSKGTVRETGLRKPFLAKYLPQNVKVIGSGEIVATNGETSGQCDVIIVDPTTPPLYTEDDYQVVPSECVDAVIEVKTKLTIAELQSAWMSVRRVKMLPKIAYRPLREQVILRSTHMYGEDLDYWPTMGFIFAYESASIDALTKEFARLAREEPDAALRVDGVFILSTGTILWLHADSLRLASYGRPGDHVVATKATPTEVLMSMMAHLNIVLSQVNHRVFDPLPYLSGTMGKLSSGWPTVGPETPLNILPDAFVTAPGGA